ncbi:hypothetical protein M427DRAFT_132214 [Gonapodya prolifera JEL478]|uniref:DUF2252 domain-containing protein n=1 Tax=Gonapodya prolifera (strain JEL478) TaxID=1344416 RepID=A0A139AR15_GONPJ|nr:hypothetical protein M427DRAFT_132214 [Gonapodya prolifera JEL478]|eukprot:KXS19190.1 hypothetical protein M427DRAFT_132214 [Gonapodya prolifera JEL478]
MIPRRLALSVVSAISLVVLLSFGLLASIAPSPALAAPQPSSQSLRTSARNISVIHLPDPPPYETTDEESAYKKKKKPAKKPAKPDPGSPLKPQPGPPTLKDAWARIERWNRFLPENARRYKYCAMAESPFRFLRATNHLFWEDLANDKRKWQYGGERMHRAWLQGDLHPENWGTFHDPNSVLVYGVNDFDDAIMDDYQLDLWRMSTGIILWSQTHFTELLPTLPSIRDTLVLPFVKAYIDKLADIRGRGGKLDNGDSLTLETVKEPLLSFMEKVNRTKTRPKMIEGLCTLDEEGRQIFDLVRASDKLRPITVSRGRELLIAYRDTYSRSLATGTGKLRWDPEGYFKVKDMVQRIDQGTSSLGQDRYYFLIEGKTTSPEDDRVLDIKHQRAPCGLLFWYWDRREEYDDVFSDNHARAFVEAGRSMTDNTDEHIGWIVLYDATMFSVSDLSPYKKKINPAKMDSLELLTSLAKQWGHGLAVTHVRSNDKNVHVSDAIQNRVLDAIGKDEKGFLDLVWEITTEFYNTVEADFADFKTNLGDVCREVDAEGWWMAEGWREEELMNAEKVREVWQELVGNDGSSLAV